MIKMAGCYPEMVDTTDDIDATEWDGAVMPDGWVKHGEEYSIHFYRAIAERNIPHIGTSKAARQIDLEMKRLPYEEIAFEELVRKAMTFKRAKNLMDGMLTIDTHCDLPEGYANGYSVGKKTESQCSVQKMEEGHLAAQVLISFLWQGPTDDASSQKPPTDRRDNRRCW